MAALLSAFAASLRASVQQQRIQPLPVFWLACESATDRSSRTGQHTNQNCYSLPVRFETHLFPVRLWPQLAAASRDALDSRNAMEIRNASEIQ
jgi:hypothetical protein